MFVCFLSTLGIHAAFAARNIPVVSNQIRYNLIDRSAERSGLIETANELGITTLAYEPLAKGLLTGKYTEPEMLVSPGRRFTNQQLKFYKPLISLLKFTGALDGGGQPKTITEVALSYIISKGIVPIVGVKTEGQARSVVSAMDPNRSLSKEFIDVLDEKADYLEKQRR